MQKLSKVDTRTALVDVPPAQAFAPIRRLGGSAGWYFGDALWKVRGWLDRCAGGPGMNRGRRDPEQCVVGDVVDGWTVEACEPDRLLRLSADIRLPGRGWLEFEVTPVDGGSRSCVRVTARFDPRGRLGRLYWLATLPIHHLMFSGLLRGIVRRAEEGVRMPGVSMFVHRSVVPAAASEVFRWHERPRALLDLLPSGGWVRVENRTGGLCDGDQVTISIGVGRLRVAWEARHFGYVRDRQFCDEQVRGPFRTWRHTHRIEAIGTRQSLYEDRIEYTLPGGLLAHRLLDGLVQRLLAHTFARRHEIVRRRLRGRRGSPNRVAILNRTRGCQSPATAGPSAISRCTASR